MARRTIQQQLDAELTGADFSGPEETTQVIPVISAAERSGRWRAAQLESKQLRSVGSRDATQRLAVCR